MAHVSVIVGSLRADSANKKLAVVARKHAPVGLTLSELSYIAELPFYNQDLDTQNPPLLVEKIREEIASSDGVLLIIPENNGTIPAVVKNVIDWCSRPYGNSCLTQKPYAVIGASLGRSGGAQAIGHTELCLNVAGGKKVDAESIPIPISVFEGKDPIEIPRIVEQVTTILDSLVRAVR